MVFIHFFGRTVGPHYSLFVENADINDACICTAICVIIPRNHGRVETVPQLPHRVPCVCRAACLDTATVTPPGPSTKQLLIRKPFLVDIHLDNEEMEDGIQRLLSTDTLLWKCENQNVCQTLLQQVL